MSILITAVYDKEEIKMSQLTPLKFSLILPTCNRAELVKQFLESVSEQTILPYAVIVVDQSDDTKTKEVFERWNVVGIQKKYIHKKIKSLILARHTGLDACSETELVAFFDDDILLGPSFCESIVRVFAEDTQHHFAGGMGTVDEWKYTPKFLQKLFLMPHEGNGKFLASGVQTFPHWKKEFCETEFLSGGCTFWRRTVVQQYRFDERLSGYGHGDDVDISYRVSRDYKLFFQPQSVCYQKNNPPGRDQGRRYRRAWVQNMYYLAQKNHIFMPAYAWCVVGHIFRDLICFDFSKVRGDLDGVWNILRGQIDTVKGYEEFKQGLRK